MSKIFQLLNSLLDDCFLTGNECTYRDKAIPNVFSEIGAKIDDFGNLWVEKKSDQINGKNVLIEAHLDQIGLCVKDITDSGFLAVCPCGGFDVNLIPGTEFIVHGNQKHKGIAGSVPPHLLKNKDAAKKLSFDDVYLDCGFSSKKEAERFVSIGSPVTFAAPCTRLFDNRICCPSLDNKAAVVALLLTIERVKPKNNLTFIFSVGEESTSRGVKNADLMSKFDFGIVVDAGFARSKGIDSDQTIQMDSGPSVSIADTLSRDAALWVIEVAKQKSLQLQTIVEPGGTGTSTTAMQLRAGGIPCALISIPLRNMHTQSEIVSERDIELTADLLCALLECDDYSFGEVDLRDDGKL